MSRTLWLGLLFFGNGVFSQRAWPVLRHYAGNSIDRIAMPVGGIGTGDISIGGNGQWRDVEIMNKPGLGFYGSTSPQTAPCFMIFTQDKNGRKVSRALMGPVSKADYAGMSGSPAPNHGLPRFTTASFDAAYPFAVVNLEDDQMPVSAKVKTFNPFIPGDAENSGIPVAVISYQIRNKTKEPLTVAIAGAMDNFIGMDGNHLEFDDFDRSLVPVGANHNRNVFRQTGKLSGIYMTSDSVARDASTWGNIALTTAETGAAYQISHRISFNPKGWNANLNDMWEDFSDDGVYKDTVYADKGNTPRCALAVKFKLGPGEVREIKFLLSWYFPNRKDWSDKETVGNYYTTLYKDAWDVAEHTMTDLLRLENKTLQFVKLILNSSYPEVAKEAALFNASTLRSQTTFRTADGNFFGWEGVFNSTGSCWGNCSHVWNYEYASPFLFGSLAKSMRNTAYQYGFWDSAGGMSFRLGLPLGKHKGSAISAADGQMGTIMRVYREWQLSGDDDFLIRLWPGIKKSLSFAWIPGGWDADKDGVMEGCQHNTMDIEYFGPNPEIEFWYLGALKAVAAIAGYMKDTAFETTCRQLFAKGSQWTDAHLFNGEYYIQKIRPIADRKNIARGLMAGMGADDTANPDFQIGGGCLVDQLAAQNMAGICGLGYLADPRHIRSALQSIWKYNHIKSFRSQFNNMRSYGLGKESGLQLLAYPDASQRPAIPLSYASEAWTGLEYTAATGMIQEGLYNEALQTVSNVRNRYSGDNRNPFNEEECGNHYVRAMASWSLLLSLSQFGYSAVDDQFTITAKQGRYFWSNGYSWGNASVSGGRVSIDVYFGTLKIKKLVLPGFGEVTTSSPVVLQEGERHVFIVKRGKGK